MSLARWPLVFAVGVGLLLYLRSPIDLLPDRIGAMGLLDDLLVAVSAIWWLRRRIKSAEPTEPTGPRPQAPRDPHAVLGVARGATAETIARAYREQMKLYHPDRVASLGPELRALAHEKCLEIQCAYEAIGKRRPFSSGS